MVNVTPGWGSIWSILFPVDVMSRWMLRLMDCWIWWIVTSSGLLHQWMLCLVNVTFGQCYIWSMLHLVNVTFGQCNIWSILHLADVMFGWGYVQSMLCLVEVMFNQCYVTSLLRPDNVMSSWCNASIGKSNRCNAFAPFQAVIGQGRGRLIAIDLLIKIARFIQK
jgi:hypothetical protein